MKKNRRKEKDRFCGINGGIKSPRYPGRDASSILYVFQNEGRALSFAAFYAVAEARVAFRQKEGARRSGYVDRKWSVAPRRQLLHGHPYQLFHT